MIHLLAWNSQVMSAYCMSVFGEPILAASGKSVQDVLIGLGSGLSLIITALSCALYFLIRYRCSRPLDDSRIIFRELCHAHDLTGPERRLVRRLAAGLELACPAALFVDSSLWRLPDGSDRRRRISKADWDKLLKLQCTLFLPPPAKAMP
jgi:hypothetical protein